MKCTRFISLLSLLVLSSSEWSSADTTTDFAVDLYKKIGNKNSGKNVFFSPVSILTAFGMVHLGARGETKAQLKNVLKLKSLGSDEAINNVFKQLLTNFNQQDSNYSVSLVNRLFGSNGFNFNQKFLDDSHEFFKSTLESLDFVQKPDESRVHINNWVSHQTNGKIKDLLSAGSVDPITILVIVNAIYFKAKWEFQFSPVNTKPGPFRISNSEQVQMDMMHLSPKFLNYYDSQELNSEILELPYQGGKASMFIVLPRDVEGLPRLEEKLTGEMLSNALVRVRGQQVIVTLPKFTMDLSIPLKQFLQLLGMTDVFDAKKSDLSGIAHSGRLYASDAAHKAFVSVNEYGTEAAAATAVVIMPGSAPFKPVEFNVDRPFLFMIKSKNPDVTLFLGRIVRSPATNQVIGRFGESASLASGAPTSASMSLAVWSAVLLIGSLFVH